MDTGCAPHCSLSSSRAGSKTLTPAPPGSISSLKWQILPSSPEAKTRYAVGSSSEAQAVESCPSCTGPCCRSPQSPRRTDSSTGAHLQAEGDRHLRQHSRQLSPNPEPPFTCPKDQGSTHPEPRRLQAGCHHTPGAFRVMTASLDLLCTSGWPPSQREGPGPPCPQGHSHFSKRYPGPTQSSQRAGDRCTSTAVWACSLGAETSSWPPPQLYTLLLLHCSHIDPACWLKLCQLTAGHCL